MGNCMLHYRGGIKGDDNNPSQAKEGNRSHWKKHKKHCIQGGFSVMLTGNLSSHYFYINYSLFAKLGAFLYTCHRCMHGSALGC